VYFMAVLIYQVQCKLQLLPITIGFINLQKSG